MKAVIVDMKCITDLHAGNGDVNYNIIDNEIEKDPVTGYPTVNSSGVKGALREFFRKSSAKPDTIKDIFGDDQRGESTPGRVKILGAEFLYMPVRASAGTEPYYYVTTQAALDRYQKLAEMLDAKIIDISKKEKADNGAEGEGIPLTDARKVGENKVYVLDERTFRKLPLPVVARNHLNDGKSENLWYEEVVPHESRFFFAAVTDDADVKLLQDFQKSIDGKIVQFGADASIGRGLCMLHVIA